MKYAVINVGLQNSPFTIGEKIGSCNTRLGFNRVCARNQCNSAFCCLVDSIGQALVFNGEVVSPLFSEN